MSQAFTVRVPATSANIGPGFDCLGVALNLYLTLECAPSRAFSLELAGEGAGQLPVDRRNLLVRCLVAGTRLGGAAAGSAAAGKPAQPLPAVQLHITNDIPLARGLGSSSAAIVAGLTAGLLLARSQSGPAAALSDDERALIVREATRIEGHPDNVAPAVLGDLVVCGMDGDSVITIAQSWPERLRLVAVVPELRVRTDDARRALPANVTHADAVANGARLATLLASLGTGRFQYLKGALQDRLHQPYRLPLAIGLAEALSTLEDQPQSLGAYLSGSGPTVMALCTAGSEELGKTGVQSFAAREVAARFLDLRADRHGVSINPN